MAKFNDPGCREDCTWLENSTFIIHSIKKMTAAQEATASSMNEMRVDVVGKLAELKTELKFKSGIWGAVAGLLSGVSVLVIVYLKQYL